jgi:hypothetical protein
MRRTSEYRYLDPLNYRFTPRLGGSSGQKKLSRTGASLGNGCPPDGDVIDMFYCTTDYENYANSGRG